MRWPSAWFLCASLVLLPACLGTVPGPPEVRSHLAPGELLFDGEDVAVSPAGLFGPGPVSETTVAIDPTNPLSVSSFAIDFSTQDSRAEFSTNRGFFSIDGGRTWGDVGPLPIPGDEVPDGGDPVVTFDADGTAYFVSLVNPDGESRHLFVYRSSDGGRSWDDPSVAHAPAENRALQECQSVDKNWIAAGGPGEVVLTYTGVDFVCASDSPMGSLEPAGLKTIDVFVTRSTDGGRTWAPRVSIWQGYGLGSTPVVAADGSIHVAFFATAMSTTNRCASPVGGALSPFGGGPFPTIVVASSRDEGRTWSRFHHDVCGADNPGENGPPFSVALPAFAIDRSTGALFLAYEDYVGTEDRTRIVVTSSLDGARTWSRAVDASRGDDASLPALAVSNGTAWLMYRAGQGTWLTRSTDDGASWMEKVPLSSMSAPNGGGDYVQLAVDGGRLVALWSDDRAGEMLVYSRAALVG